MSQEPLNAAEVANFLANNPDFFEQNADIFAALKVPHPHKTQAISLGERQILTLRSRLKNHESQLQSLVYNASGNQKINSALMQWCTQMLAQQDIQKIPEMISTSLKEQFNLLDVALQAWDLPQLKESKFCLYTSSDLINYASTLDTPYCGPVIEQSIFEWLDQDTKSMAAIPLKSFINHQLIGLLIFCSEDQNRFTSDMGTDFLQLVAKLSGAALSRLQ